MVIVKFIWIVLLLTSTGCIEMELSEIEIENGLIVNVEKWLNLINLDMKSINRYSAFIAWEMSINPTDELFAKGLNFSVMKSRWRNKRCSEADFLPADNKLEPIQKRMLNLLCRGPKFTEYQASEVSNIVTTMQEVYTESKICLPKRFDLCRNGDHIWDYTFVRKSRGEFFQLDFSKVVSRKDRGKLSELNYFDGQTDRDYFIFGPKQNSDDNSVLNGEFICFDGEPDLEQIMTGDFAQLQRSDCMLNTITTFRWAWESWRLAVGIPIGELYPGAVFLMNLGATNNGYHDIGEVWREELEVPRLREIVQRLWHDVKPLYQLLHAVMRSALFVKFRDSVDYLEKDGPIPAHILGNMWSQNWATYHKLLIPFGGIDLDERIRDTSWSTLDMVKRADDFYSSLGLHPMTKTFWEKSFFERTDNFSKCHGTAANMFQPNDYRMIVCAKKSMEDFYVIHHEMGHLHYYMAYVNQPTLFQDGTNTAFQEAIGDAVFNGVMTPQHLNRLRLLPDEYLFPENDKTKISWDLLSTIHGKGEHLATEVQKSKSVNFLGHSFPSVLFQNKNNTTVTDSMNSFDVSLLLKIALAKIPQIPFELILDNFRWDLFSGKISMADANDYFWQLSEQEQGIKPPGNFMTNRKNMFDAGAKYHVADNTPYIRYFLASFLQAQIFKGLCQQTVFDRVDPNEKLPMPLHRCDIYGSKRAGNLLKESMSLGASVHWTQILNTLTGSKEITATALLEYYQPLTEWLKRVVIEFDLPVGW